MCLSSGQHGYSQFHEWRVSHDFNPCYSRQGFTFPFPPSSPRTTGRTQSVPCQHIQQKPLPSVRTERTDSFISDLGMVCLLPTSGKLISKLINQTHQSPFWNTCVPITLRKLFLKPNLIALKVGYVLLTSCWVCFLGNITLQLKYYFPFSGFYFNYMFVDRMLICQSCYFGKLSNLFAVVWSFKNGLTQQNYSKYLLYLLFCILFFQNSAVMIIWSQKTK